MRMRSSPPEYSEAWWKETKAQLERGWRHFIRNRPELQREYTLQERIRREVAQAERKRKQK